MKAEEGMIRARAQQSFATKLRRHLVEEDEVTIRRHTESSLAYIEREERHDLPVLVREDDEGGYIEQAETAARESDDPEVVVIETVDVSDVDGVERM
jgi:hypothetical protein